MGTVCISTSSDFDDSGWAVLSGIVFLISGIGIGICFWKRKAFFFVSVSPKGVNISNRQAIPWDRIHSMHVQEMGKGHEKLVIVYQDGEDHKKVEILDQLDGYEYVKNLIANEYSKLA